MDEREQEKVLGRLLARNLRQHLEPGGADCPDADLLAAYTESSLGDVESSRLEAHFSVCGRCQEALAALALSEVEHRAVTEEEFAPAEERDAASLAAAMADLRATVPPPPATMAIETAAARSTRPAVLGSPDYNRPKRRFWSVRWLAPAVAAAAAVILWIGLHPTLLQRSTPATPLETKSASAPPPEANSAEATAEPPKELAQNAAAPPPADALESRVQEPAGEASHMSSKETAAKPRVAQAPEKLQRETKTLSAETTGPQMMDQKRAAARGTAGIAAAPTGGISGEKGRADRALQPQRREVDTTSAAATKPGGAVTHTFEVAQAPEKEREGKLEKKLAAVAPGATPAPLSASNTEEASKKAADTQGGAPRQQYSAAMRQKMVFPPAQITITTANPSVIWRVGVAGQIELSRDSGRTWTGQASNVSVDLAAGSAPSETVCWVVGRAGTVLRTIDGEHWEKLSPPTATDLIRVRAPDALHATVVAANQQRYITADGGKTWRASTE